MEPQISIKRGTTDPNRVYCLVFEASSTQGVDYYTYLGYHEGDFPETESAAREIFSLPMFPSLQDSEQDRVIQALHEIMAEIG